MHSAIRSFLTPMLWRAVKRRYDRELPTVIAVTGSVGKTSAKEAIAAVLATGSRPVVKTAGNLNTQTGVALSLLGFSEYPRSLSSWLGVGFRVLFPPHLRGERPYYVLEFSTDKPGDISFLASHFPIDIAVITRIVPAHAEFFPSFADYVQEKRSLLKALKPDGYALLNSDDPNQQCVSVPTCWYGLSEAVHGQEQVIARDVSSTQLGVSFTVSFSASRHMESIGRRSTGMLRIQSHFFGKHQIYPLLAAVAIGHKEGIAGAKVQQALDSLEPMPGRGRLIEGRKDSVIIDDSYNASPESAKAGLDMLRTYAGSRRVVGILGRMNELGTQAPQFHDEVATYAVGKADFLVFVGEYATRQVKAAVKAGQPKINCIAFKTTENLIDKLDQVVNRGDVVYVKGSQNGVRLERVVKALMLRPAEALSLLVRQNPHWKP